MKTLIILALFFGICAAETTKPFRRGDPCPDCLFPIWFDSIAMDNDEFCRTRRMSDVFNCVRDCTPQPSNMPETFVMRTLTQIIDILRVMKSANCRRMYIVENTPADVGDSASKGSSDGAVAADISVPAPDEKSTDEVVLVGDVVVETVDKNNETLANKTVSEDFAKETISTNETLSDNSTTTVESPVNVNITATPHLAAGNDTSENDIVSDDLSSSDNGTVFDETLNSTVVSSVSVSNITVSNDTVSKVTVSNVTQTNNTDLATDNSTTTVENPVVNITAAPHIAAGNDTNQNDIVRDELSSSDNSADETVLSRSVRSTDSNSTTGDEAVAEDLTVSVTDAEPDKADESAHEEPAFTIVFTDEDDMPRECRTMTECFDAFAVYEYENSTDFSPYPTVFNYDCQTPYNDTVLNVTTCMKNANCDQRRTINKIVTMVEQVYQAACNTSRRCVMYGNIFETFPGSSCTQYLQEALAYGPSTGKPLSLQEGLGFDTKTTVCKSEWLDRFDCPADPDYTPILSEGKPPQEKREQGVETFQDITIDTTLNCARCLHSLWEAVVMTNGTQNCERRVRVLMYRCLDNCANNPVDVPQRWIDALVKVSDIQKSLQLNDCPSDTCDKKVWTCLEEIAIFTPAAAPHVTVNRFNCTDAALERMYSCFNDACPDGVPKTLFTLIEKGFNGICRTDVRCMTHGNIYELVSRNDILRENKEEWNEMLSTDKYDACSFYSHAPANGWQLYDRVISVISYDTLRFSVKPDVCTSDWQTNTYCPREIDPLAPTTTEAPTTQPPSTEAPATEEPVNEEPTNEESTNEEPTNEEPTGEASNSEVLTVEEDGAEAPSKDTESAE